MQKATLKKLTKNFVILKIDGLKIKIDLRHDKDREAIAKVIRHDPLFMAVGSVIEVTEMGRITSSDYFGIPQTGRPRGNPQTAKERMRRYRARQKDKSK